MIHNFNESNAKSQDAKLSIFWDNVYREFFGESINISKTIQDRDLQLMGVDRVVTLTNNKNYLIDEKIRFSEYPDILLEHTSCLEKQTKGWINKDLAIDYIMYAFYNSQKCYVLDYQSLKRTWRYYGNKWISKYPEIKARTARTGGFYTTLSVAVPTNILMETLSRSALIDLNKV